MRRARGPSEGHGVRVVVVSRGVAIVADHPEKLTTYGGPRDTFTRIVETFRFEGDMMHVERREYARGYVPSIQCVVGFAR